MTKPNYQGLFNGCVSYWDFNGDAKDCIGGNDGSVSGATLTTNHLGMTDSAYDFDSNNHDFVNFGSQPLSAGTDFTISLWVFPKNLYTDIVFLGADLSDFWLFWYEGHIRMYVGGDAININFNINNNNWYHIVFTFINSSKEGKIYLDSSLIDTNTWTNGVAGTNDDLYAGIDPRDENDYYYDGKIAYPMIFSRALSTAEVLALYNLTKYKPIYPYMRRTCQR